MVMSVGFMTSSIYATSKPVNEMSHAFVGFDENGNLIQYDTNELEEEVASSSQISMATLEDEKAITYGVVNFRVKGSIAEIHTIQIVPIMIESISMDIQSVMVPI